MKTINEIRKGDIVYYRNGRINHVNQPDNYKNYYNRNFENIGLYSGFDIMKIQRYKKILWFYVLKTIYVR